MFEIGMMNRILIIGLLLCLIWSCKEISFKEPQPKGKKQLTMVPKPLRGNYLTYKEDGALGQDTIIITSRGYQINYAEPSETKSHYDQGILSDSLVLKNYKGYYFLSFLEGPEWILRVIRQHKNGDLILMAPEQEGVDFKDYVNKLSKQIRIDSLQAGDKMVYQIDPSADQLIYFIEHGYFSRAVLKKIK
jgi:hypothetical protein